MENATKALIMAAGVLIAVLILAFAVYLFSTLGGYSASVEKHNEANRLAQFNSTYTVYLGKTELTIHDVVSIINSARNNNENYYLDEELIGNEVALFSEANKYIKVTLDGTSCTAMMAGGDYTENISSLLQTNAEKKYTCDKIEISQITGRVYWVNLKTT